MRKLINFVLFQLGWFACILGAAYGYVSWAVLFCLAVAAFHLWQSNEPMQEGVLLLKILVLGIAADTLLLQTGSLVFESKGLLPALSPIWMWSLWVILGCTLNESMSWLKGRFVLAAVLSGNNHVDKGNAHVFLNALEVVEQLVGGKVAKLLVKRQPIRRRIVGRFGSRGRAGG